MSSRLAINIGNTRITCGFFQNGKLQDIRHHLVTELENAGKELTSLAKDRKVGAAAICSVVPSAERSLVHDFEQDGTLKLFTVTAESQTLVTGLYKGIGSDRIANAAAGYKLYARNAPVIVLDLGTATTLTAVSPEGKFLGGWITLGLGRTYSVLHEVTAQLPDLQFKLGVNRRIHPAFNTEDAIAGGCLLAHVGAVEYWIKSARKSLGEGTIVVATGGYSSDIKPLTDAIDEFDLQLTIKGIELIAEAAAGPKDRA